MHSSPCNNSPCHPEHPLLRHLRGINANAELHFPAFASIERDEPELVRSLTLDASQRRCLEHIFDSPAPIVQGPPGTGKSYTGVAALRLMLKHQDKVGGDGIILVVCYTNHAIDSFLSDLIESEPERFRLPDGELGAHQQHKLLRIGFRTQNEDIERRLVGKIAQQRSTGGWWHVRQRFEKLMAMAHSMNFVPNYVETPDHVLAFFEELSSSKAATVSQLEDYARTVQAQLARANAELSRQESRFPDYSEQQLERLPELQPYRQRRHEAEQEVERARQLLEAAKDASDNFLLHWRDAKGKPTDAARGQLAAKEKNALAEQINDDDDDDSVDEERLDREADGRADAHGACTSLFVPRTTGPARHFFAAAVLPDRYTAAQRYEAYDFFCNQRMLAFLPEIARSSRGSQHRACPVTKRGRKTNKGKLLKQARVIGATTSGIAKYLDILRNLPIRCVICEEAAEISECHSLATLLPHVEHYIQIGDHQQLRPKVECHELRKNNLHISMMERMVRCGMLQAPSMCSGVCDQRSAN
jgi:hypothetical protein